MVYVASIISDEGFANLAGRLRTGKDRMLQLDDLVRVLLDSDMSEEGLVGRVATQEVAE